MHIFNPRLPFPLPPQELRDLVRSLGRGGGWGPLRRAPVQHLDPSARPGLLRTVLEAQETRGLTRADDISRLLPAEAELLARGKTVGSCLVDSFCSVKHSKSVWLLSFCALYQGTSFIAAPAACCPLRRRCWRAARRYILPLFLVPVVQLESVL